MTMRLRSSRVIAAILVAGAALGLTACAPSFSEEDMIATREPLAETMVDVVDAIGVESVADGWEGWEPLTQSRWCRELGSEAEEGGRLVMHSFSDTVKLLVEMSSIEIEETITDIFEDDGMVVKTEIDGTYYTTTARTYVEGVEKSVGTIAVSYYANPGGGTNVTMRAATQCSRVTDGLLGQ